MRGRITNISRRQIITASSAFGLSLFAPQSLRADQPRNLTLGVTGFDPLYSHVFIAKEAGLFRKYGIEANIINAQSGARIAQMVAAGQIDYAMSGIFDAMRLTISGKPSKLIAGFDQRIPYSSAVINKDNATTYRRIEDLAGQSVAVTQPQTPMWVMAVYLAEKAGIKDKITFRAAGDFISLLAMVKTKQVAAGWATVSMMDAAVHEGWGVPLFDAADEKAWNGAFGGAIVGTGCWALSKTIESNFDALPIAKALAEAQTISLSWEASRIVDLVGEKYFRSLERGVAIRNIEKFQSGIWARDNFVDEASYGRAVALAGGGRMYSDAELAAKADYKSIVDMSFVKAARGT